MLVQVLLGDVVDHDGPAGRTHAARVAAVVAFEVRGHVLLQDTLSCEELMALRTRPLDRLCAQSFSLVEAGVVADVMGA